MNHIIKTVIIVMVLICLLSGRGYCQETPPFQQRLIFVNDYGVGYWIRESILTRRSVHAFVDGYAGTQVTTYMACASAGEELLLYRSKYDRIAGDDDGGRLDCDNSSRLGIKKLNQWLLNLEKEGYDVTETQLERAKEKGMEAFITFRMNDLHYKNLSLRCPVTYSDFWFQHPEYWINEKLCERYHLGAQPFDFVHSEVREHKLNVIFEQLDLYGSLLDGYDLDFLRAPIFFKAGEGAKNASLITEMVKAVKSKIDDLSAQYGKKIMLSARVPHDMDFCNSEGLDIKEWLRLGLLDFLTIGYLWEENPFPPVAQFIQALGDRQIPLYVSMDGQCYGLKGKKTVEFHSHGMKRGIASQIYAQAADGIYLFNFMPPIMIACPSDKYVCRLKSRDLLSELGSMETLRKRNKRFGLDNGAVAFYFRYRGVAPLPLAVGSAVQTIDFHVGDPVQQDVPEQIIVHIRTDQAVTIGLQVNSVEAKPLDETYIQPYEADKTVQPGEKDHAFMIPASAVKQGYNKIGIYSHESECRVIRLEMVIRYGDVEKYGYF